MSLIFANQNFRITNLVQTFYQIKIWDQMKLIINLLIPTSENGGYNVNDYYINSIASSILYG